MHHCPTMYLSAFVCQTFGSIFSSAFSPMQQQHYRSCQSSTIRPLWLREQNGKSETNNTTTTTSRRRRQEQTRDIGNSVTTDMVRWKEDEPTTPMDVSYMRELERTVLASTLAELDVKRVGDALLLSTEKDEDIVTEHSLSSSHPHTPPHVIAIASASIATLFSILILHVPFELSLVLFPIVFFLASRDPLDDGMLGALARILGRLTIQSLDKSKPKVRAITRAVLLTDDTINEVDELKKQIIRLERENQELKRYIERRKAMEERLGDYSLTELKDMARKRDILVGGTKSQLMMKLVEAGILDLGI